MSRRPVRDPAAALRAAALIYAGAWLLHNGDHVRRGFDVVTPHVLAAGTVQTVLSVVAVTAVLLGHRLGAVLALVVGFGSAIGVSAAHLLPEWSAFSDAFPGSEVAAISWVAVLIEVAASLLLGAAGALALRAPLQRATDRPASA